MFDSNTPPSQQTGQGKLFVGQVPAVCTEEILLPIFSTYGTIVEIKIMRDHQNRSKGCAWVRYQTTAMAQKAIDALNEKHTIPPQTNALKVQFAQQKPPQHQQPAPHQQYPNAPHYANVPPPPPSQQFQVSSLPPPPPPGPKGQQHHNVPYYGQYPQQQQGPTAYQHYAQQQPAFGGRGGGGYQHQQAHATTFHRGAYPNPGYTTTWTPPQPR